MADMVHPLNWTYLPEFDTYYMIHGDTNFRILKCLEGVEELDDSLVILYEPDSTFYGTQGDLWQVKLEPSGEEWKILSNICLERTVNLYYPDAAVEKFVRTEARISGTPQSMVDALIELGALPEGTKVNSFTEDGAGSAVLDMNQVYGQALNRTGTAGERSLLGSLANTFIQRYGLINLTITIDGKILETGHGIFDAPFEFFTFI